MVSENRQLIFLFFLSFFSLFLFYLKQPAPPPWTAPFPCYPPQMDASWVLGTFKDRSKFLMTLLFKTMVRSRLEYCSALWNPHRIQDIQSLEAIQRSFTRRISGCQNLNYWERLKFLHLPSLQRRRERYIIINTWKILQKKAPNDINMVFYESDRLGVRVKVPPRVKGCPSAISSIYEHSFSVKAAKLWNILPKSVNTAQDLNSLKAALGKFLEKFPDTVTHLQPRVTHHNAVTHY